METQVLAVRHCNDELSQRFRAKWEEAPDLEKEGLENRNIHSRVRTFYYRGKRSYFEVQRVDRKRGGLEEEQTGKAAEGVQMVILPIVKDPVFRITRRNSRLRVY